MCTTSPLIESARARPIVAYSEGTISALACILLRPPPAYPTYVLCPPSSSSSESTSPTSSCRPPLELIELLTAGGADAAGMGGGESVPRLWDDVTLFPHCPRSSSPTSILFDEPALKLRCRAPSCEGFTFLSPPIASLSSSSSPSSFPSPPPPLANVTESDVMIEY